MLRWYRPQLRALVYALGSLTVGCAGSQAARFETVSEFPEDAERHPAGVSVDPVSELPPSQDRADTSAGVVVLTTPADPAQGRESVRRFFRAVVSESTEDLEAELGENAQIQLSSGARLPVAAFWRQRFASLDYAALAGSPLFRDKDIETYRGADIKQLGGRRRFPIAVPDDSMLVRVKLAITRSGRTRIFADEIYFLLRPSSDGYKISEVVEDFQLP
ncbi:MAG: hypothetical protein KC766_20320 [Myxococcales bacterium]|nr:hypothetical protein [Myxococcales bacterium]